MKIVITKGQKFFLAITFIYGLINTLFIPFDPESMAFNLGKLTGSWMWFIIVLGYTAYKNIETNNVIKSKRFKGK